MWQDLYGKMCLWISLQYLCLSCSQWNKWKKSISLPVDWTGLLERKMATHACDKQFSNMPASSWYPIWDQFLWHFPPINLIVLHTPRGKSFYRGHKINIHDYLPHHLALFWMCMLVLLYFSCYILIANM